MAVPEINSASLLRRTDLLVVLLLTAVVALLYQGLFGQQWTYDDFMVIVDNPDVRSWTAFFENSYPGRPIRELSYLLDHALFGMKPAGWHLQDLFWHALNGSLIYLLLVKFGAGRAMALLAALLFLVHPLQVEVVANTSHRKDSLALAFCLMSLLAYLRATVSQPLVWRSVALATYVVAVLAKQNAVILPLVAASVEVLLLPPSRRFVTRLPGFCWWLAGAVAVGLAGWFFTHGAAAGYLQWSNHLLVKLENYDGLAGGAYPKMLLASWAFMLLRVVWPFDLAVEYLTPVPVAWSDPWVLCGVLVPFLTLIAIVFCWRRYPWLSFGLLWTVLFWLPTSNLWPMVYPAADRYLYTPLVGLAIVSAWLLTRPRLRLPGRLAAVVLLAGLVTVSWQQVGVWQSDETLYLHALKVSPKSSLVRNELGKYYYKDGQLQKALGYYREALEVNPRNVAVHYNLGQVYETAGFLQQALDHYALFLGNDVPAYRATAEDLRNRLRRDHGLVLRPGEGP